MGTVPRFRHTIWRYILNSIDRMCTDVSERGRCCKVSCGGLLLGLSRSVSDELPAYLARHPFPSFTLWCGLYFPLRRVVVIHASHDGTSAVFVKSCDLSISKASFMFANNWSNISSALSALEVKLPSTLTSPSVVTMSTVTGRVWPNRRNRW